MTANQAFNMAEIYCERGNLDDAEDILRGRCRCCGPLTRAVRL